MKIIKRLFLLFLFMVFLCMLCQIIGWWWEAGTELIMYPQNYPDVYHTAEYLYANPLPTPEKHQFYPAPGSVYDDDLYYQLCVIGVPFVNVWAINGKRLPNWMWDGFSSIWASLGDPEDDWLSIHNCVWFLGMLPPGIHMAEVQYGGIFSLFFPFLPSTNSYQWAFKIEPTPTHIPPTPTP